MFAFQIPPFAAYQVWDSIQGLSSYVRGMLSSQAMLAGLGVGSQEATPLGAVFQASPPLPACSLLCSLALPSRPHKLV